MKTEKQIKRKFGVLVKERKDAFTKRYQVEKGWRLSGNKKAALKNYDELIAKQNGFLEALNWVIR